MSNVFVKFIATTSILTVLSTAALAQDGGAPVTGTTLISTPDTEIMPQGLQDGGVLQSFGTVGPLALGLGAIVAIGMITNGGSTTSTAQKRE